MNRLLADNSHVISSHFCQKLRKMSQNLSSAAVMIGALRVNSVEEPLWINHLPCKPESRVQSPSSSLSDETSSCTLFSI